MDRTSAIATDKNRSGISPIIRLRCSVQNYEWGRSGRVSAVAKLFALNSGSQIDPDKPYAEFWMGTHESGPSYVVLDGDSAVMGSKPVSLKSWITQNSGVLGDKVVECWGTDLPFLFKVLSVAKALSIQAHPDKELARILHKLKPRVYKNDNHKPEMALALTDFEALCGFISLEELKDVLRNVPEITELVGCMAADQVLNMNKKEEKDEVKSVLQSIFTELMSASKERISEAISRMKSRLFVENQARQLTEKEQLVLRLEKQYRSDVGVMAAFFLNYVKLSPGEALYLAANEPHAYLCGECIECMATSDNVVRAGLTPKERDVQTLCSMLTYKQGYPEILKGIPLNSYTRRYLPPFDEFEVDCCVLPCGASVAFPAVPGPSIFLVVAGEGTMRAGLSEDGIAEGDVLFAAADTEIILTSSSDELRLYRAGVNSRFF